jgi:integrase
LEGEEEMKGHLRQRSPGHWAIVLDVRDPETNWRKRRWHSFTGTKREAQAECARLIAELKTGVQVDPTRMTVAAYLDHWLAHKRTRVSPRSYENYTAVIRLQLVPLIGNSLVAKLRPAEIANAYSKALESGRRDGLGGLSPRSVHTMHRILSQALKQAVRWQMIARNPCDAVTPPRVERKPMKVVDARGAIALMDAARDRAIFLPVLVGVLCGLRRGEAAALCWRDVNLETAQLSIVHSLEQTNNGVRFKPPKSGRPRTVALPAMGVEELRQHRIKQAEELLRLGIRQSDDTHVCLQPNYQPWTPRNLSSAFIKFMVASGLPRVRLHDLRHSHATHLLAANVHPKVVQERLGHANIATTMDLYTHVMPGMQDEAASRVDAILRAASSKDRGTKG